MGGGKQCNDSERDDSTEEQMQLRKQYLCHPHDTVCPAIAIAMDYDNARIHARTQWLGFLNEQLSSCIWTLGPKYFVGKYKRM